YAPTGAQGPAEGAPAFVGADACASCHQTIHGTWKSGRHSKMLQPATTASVVGDFSKGSVTLHGTRFPLRTAGGNYFITSDLTGKEREYRVENTLGSRRIRPFQQWNKDCVGCHVSQQENNFRPATGNYATTWRDFGTSCERCHGPGSAHVKAFSRTEGRPSSAEGTIVRPTRLTSARSSMIC